MKKDERQLLLKEKLLQMKCYEQALYEKGERYIAGVDEVGRGPLAGPVVAAAVVLPSDFAILGVDDSKKLSPKKRDELYDAILANAIAYGIGLVDHATIDRINILEATKLAMKEALRECEKNCLIGHVLIDALHLKEVPLPQTAIIKGDAKSVSIAAASIVAKVTRDRMMMDYDALYPGYSFAANKGYGTAAHYEGLRKQGICPIHRRSFLKDFS
ncbi:MAG: ribonuclease HII [Eubacteriales bacterium]|nr:ribonuclease HII [Eubacteriales bacterium]